MQVRNFVPQDEAGNLLTEGLVEVRDAGTGALALVYGSDSTADPLDNPFEIPADGLVTFACPDGVYDVTFTSGDTARTMPSEKFFSSGAQDIDMEGVGGGVDLYYDKDENTLQLKTIEEGDNVEVTDLGERVRIHVPGGPASTSFDIEFAGHSPAGDLHFETPRGSVAAFDGGEAIGNVVIETLWPMDAEIRASVDLRVMARMGLAVTPDEAQLGFLNGTLYLAREGDEWVMGTPRFDGQVSSGMKVEVGSVGDMLAIEITFPNGADAREVSCIASGLSYNDDNTDQMFEAVANGTSVTGPTVTYGASGLIAFAVSDETSQAVACFYESRGAFLTLKGEAVNTGLWANTAVLFNLPDPFRPRVARANLVGTFATGLPARNINIANLAIATNGDVSLLTNVDTVSRIYFDSVSPINLRQF